jgi:type IV secretion system T-DNA border endonuclease VirD1
MRAEQEGLNGADAYKIVSIRLRMAEFKDFSEQAEALGLSCNLALRIAARQISGFLEIDHAVQAQIERSLRAIGDMSQRINGLHAAYLESGAVDIALLSEQRTAFGQEFAELDALMRSILNISRRRSDGRQRLADALAIEARGVGIEAHD